MKGINRERRHRKVGGKKFTTSTVPTIINSPDSRKNIFAPLNSYFS